MTRQQDELQAILARFVASGWNVVAKPAQKWLDGARDKAALIAAVEKADSECGSCGCEFDPLYKRALVLLQAV
ncbi:MAG TPA: hypothetical protein GXZ82_12855 [Firmicutes bacterium]|jgi:hypothetical protein|nr:hypothetical protein [Bacillota bacterium]